MIFSSNLIIIVYDFLPFSCLCKTSVFSSNVLLLTPSLFCILLWQLLLGGRRKGGVLMLFGVFFPGVYLGCVNSWFAKRLWKICLTLSKEQVLHPCFARVKSPESFFSHALSVWHFWKQELEGGNSSLLRVPTTLELCKTHWCSAGLVGGWHPAQALCCLSATRRVSPGVSPFKNSVGKSQGVPVAVSASPWHLYLQQIKLRNHASFYVLVLGHPQK